MLRGLAGRRDLGVPNLWLHSPHAGFREGGDRVHAPRAGPPRRVRLWTGQSRIELGRGADGPREPHDCELPSPGRRRLRPRGIPRGCGGTQEPERAGARRGGLKEVVELQVLRPVVREARLDRFLNQLDPLPEVVRYLELLADPLRDLEVLLHRTLVNGERQVAAAFETPSPEGDPTVLRPAFRAAHGLAGERLQVPDQVGKEMMDDDAGHDVVRIHGTDP